jgi:hypothetical protein
MEKKINLYFKKYTDIKNKIKIIFFYYKNYF